MERSKIITRLWDFNAVVIAMVAIMALGFGTLASYHLAKDVLAKRHVTNVISTSSQTQTDQSPPTLALDQMTAIQGTPFMWGAVRHSQIYRGRLSRKRAMSIVDYVVYDTHTGMSRRLFAPDDVLVSRVHTVRDENKILSGQIKTPPVFYVFEVTKTDSNGDGLLSGKDQKQIAITTSGFEKTSYLPGLFDNVIGTRVAGPDHAIIIARKGSTTTAYHMNLRTLEIAKQHDIAIMPAS